MADPKAVEAILNIKLRPISVWEGGSGTVTVAACEAETLQQRITRRDLVIIPVGGVDEIGQYL